MPYYLPKGVVTLEITWDASKSQIDYVSDFKSASVADTSSGPYSLWHRQLFLSSEKAEVKIDPSTMLLSKVSSSFTPQRTEALEQVAAILKKTEELRAVIAAPPGSPLASGVVPATCSGVKVRATVEIYEHSSRKVDVVPIRSIDDCGVTVRASVTAVSPAPTGMVVASSLTEVANICAAAICLRPPRLYRVELKVSVFGPEPEKYPNVPAIPPFIVSAPDRSTLAYVRMRGGAFASREATIEMADGMLASYSVNNGSEAVGFLTFSAAALGTATAIAILDHH
jgi:hypothetical protein